MLDRQAKQVQHHEQFSRTRDLSVGQTVMTRNYGQGAKWIAGIIKQSFVCGLRLYLKLVPLHPQLNSPPLGQHLLRGILLVIDNLLTISVIRQCFRSPGF